MRSTFVKRVVRTLTLSIIGAVLLAHTSAAAADKLLVIYTARVMSQAYPWIAEEAGLFKKYDLEIPLVFVTPGAPAVAAILSGDSEVAVIGAASITRPFVQGNKDPVIIGGIKSLLTHSIIAKPDIKKPEQLKGKRIGVSRIGSNPHYFAVQALRHYGLDSRDVSYIQAGGAPETLAALVAQAALAACVQLRCAPAAAAPREHRDQGPEGFGHPLHQGSGRAEHCQHDARRNIEGFRRARRGRCTHAARRR